MTVPNVPAHPLPELLAPAGSMDALRAALDAGADAVYLGLASLNARRGAENFTPQTLPEAVRLAHEGGARVFLTLNILLTAREIGEAARTLELARSCGVDAVLIADPALLLFRPHYPELEFHFSTQAAITNSAGVQACGALGLRRAVLAREMNLAEILVAAKAGTGADIAPAQADRSTGMGETAAAPAEAQRSGVETEVFVQGALCLCVSGRCLLSSWGGGRSGNRGACTSPCRVRWEVDGADGGTPLSMHDLCALEQLPDLIEAGVRCLKIEGRLKNADWVRQAVSLYHNALQRLATDPHAAAPAGGWIAATALGNYSGRRLTASYLTGQRADMTGESGRPAGDAAPVFEAPRAPHCPQTETGAMTAQPLSLRIETGGQRLVCALQTGPEEHRWELTKTVVHNPSRAISAQQLADWLQTQSWQGRSLAAVECDEPHLLLPKKTANLVADEIAAILHRVSKTATAQSKRVECVLPPQVRALTNPPARCAQNDRQLGHKPNMARVSCRQAATFLSIHTPEAIVVEGIVEQALQTLCDTGGSPEPAASLQPHCIMHDLSRLNAEDPFGLEALRKAVRNTRLIVALPAVLFEDAVPVAAALAQACVRYGLPIEVNGWDGWQLARTAGATGAANGTMGADGAGRATLWGGPGLAVLNPHAALALQQYGFATAHYSLEAGVRQLEELAARMPLPGTLCVYGRPVLAYTRAGLPQRLHNGAMIEDARKIRLRVERCCGLTRLRAVEPFNIAHQKDERILARWLCADLCGCQDPAAEWTRLRQPSKAPNLFNYERGLY